jgi:hypothetical protein
MSCEIVGLSGDAMLGLDILTAIRRRQLRPKLCSVLQVTGCGARLDERKALMSSKKLFSSKRGMA